MVKNRSSTEAKAKVSLEAAREKEEKLFTSPEWSPIVSGLDPNRLGIAALRTGLSNVFCAHIRAEFPAFNQQTRSILSQKRGLLVQLGPDRSTLELQKAYLNSVVETYQGYKNECLRDTLRVSTDKPEGSQLLKRLNALKKSSLREPLKHYGAKWTFQTATVENDFLSDVSADSTNVEETMITVTFLKRVKSAFLAAMEYNIDGACKNQLVATALKDLMKKAVQEKILKFETYCYDLVRNEQEGLQLVAGEEQFVREVREARTLRWISALTRLENKSSLSSVPATGAKGGAPAPTSGLFSFSTPPTSGPGVNTFGSTIAPPGPAKGNIFGHLQNPDPHAASKIESEQSFKSLITFAQVNKDRLKEVLTDERQIVYEIHDILKAYYSISVQHYTDAVCKNGLTPKFIREVMDVFSTEWVDSLTDEEVKNICAESVADRKTRRELGEDIERLERAIKESEMILNEPALG
mgnify:CR=1 FL=1